MCGLNQSPHQLMFNLYNIIALTGETLRLINSQMIRMIL